MGRCALIFGTASSCFACAFGKNEAPNNQRALIAADAAGMPQALNMDTAGLSGPPTAGFLQAAQVSDAEASAASTVGIEHSQRMHQVDGRDAGVDDDKTNELKDESDRRCQEYVDVWNFERDLQWKKTYKDIDIDKIKKSKDKDAVAQIERMTAAREAINQQIEEEVWPEYCEKRARCEATSKEIQEDMAKAKAKTKASLKASGEADPLTARKSDAAAAEFQEDMAKAKAKAECQEDMAKAKAKAELQEAMAKAKTKASPKASGKAEPSTARKSGAVALWLLLPASVLALAALATC